MPDERDDDRLLALLGEALREARAVPAEFVQAGRAAFSWYDLDAQLAALTYDSDRDPAGATREEQAFLRALTFESSDQTVELEVVHGALHGQLIPAHPGRIELHGPSGEVAGFPVDDLGYFVVTPVPAGSFRLAWHTEAGVFVHTSWVAL
jgi:hypothetical protein